MVGEDDDKLFPTKKEPLKFDIEDYVNMANFSIGTAIGSICEEIDNETIVFILKNKFHFIGDSSDSAVIAKLTNEKFKLTGDDAFDKEKVDQFVKLILRDAESGKFGGRIISQLAMAKGLMTYCNKHKEEFGK